MKTRTIIHATHYPKTPPMLATGDTMEWEAIRYYNSIPTESVAKKMKLTPKVQSCYEPQL